MQARSPAHPTAPNTQKERMQAGTQRAHVRAVRAVPPRRGAFVRFRAFCSRAAAWLSGAAGLGLCGRTPAVVTLCLVALSCCWRQPNHTWQRRAHLEAQASPLAHDAEQPQRAHEREEVPQQHVGGGLQRCEGRQPAARARVSGALAGDTPGPPAPHAAPQPAPRPPRRATPSPPGPGRRLAPALGCTLLRRWR